MQLMHSQQSHPVPPGGWGHLQSSHLLQSQIEYCLISKLLIIYYIHLPHIITRKNNNDILPEAAVHSFLGSSFSICFFNAAIPSFIASTSHVSFISIQIEKNGFMFYLTHFLFGHIMDTYFVLTWYTPLLVRIKLVYFAGMIFAAFFTIICARLQMPYTTYRKIWNIFN